MSIVTLNLDLYTSADGYQRVPVTDDNGRPLDLTDLTVRSSAREGLFPVMGAELRASCVGGLGFFDIYIARADIVAAFSNRIGTGTTLRLYRDVLYKDALGHVLPLARGIDTITAR